MSKRAYRDLVLSAMPGTQAQIRERTGLGLATVSRWCEDLRARKEAYVGGWWVHPHGGPPDACQAWMVPTVCPLLA